MVYEKYMMSRDDFEEKTLKLGDEDEIVIKVRDRQNDAD